MKDNAKNGRRRSLPAPAKGTMVAHYRILTRIDYMPTGEVYKAQDTRNNRTVCLILLLSDAIPPTSPRSRLSESASVSLGLNHPNLLGIYEAGKTEAGEYIAMEYAEGITLRQLLTGGPLSLNGILEIALQICAALNEVHRNRVILHDLLPDQIIMTKDKQVKVMTLGLKDMESESRTGAEVLPSEIVSYLSPEEIEGEPIDERSNIFSLGVILYEMMTGLLPFQEENADRLRDSIRRKAPILPSEHNPEIPAELQRITLKMLEKSPQRRYQNVGDVVFDIEHSKVKPSMATVAKKKDPWNWVVLAAVIVLLIVAAYEYVPQIISGIRILREGKTQTLMIAKFTVGDSERGAPAFLADSLASYIEKYLDSANHLKIIRSEQTVIFADSAAIFTGLQQKRINYVLAGQIDIDSSKGVGTDFSINVRLFGSSDGRLIWSSHRQAGVASLFDELSYIAGVVTDSLGTLTKSK